MTDVREKKRNENERDNKILFGFILKKENVST